MTKMPEYCAPAVTLGIVMLLLSCVVAFRRLVLRRSSMELSMLGLLLFKAIAFSAGFKLASLLCG